jgi:hypothetical protein
MISSPRRCARLSTTVVQFPVADPHEVLTGTQMSLQRLIVQMFDGSQQTGEVEKVGGHQSRTGAE